MGERTWRTYEEVARYLLDNLASEFGLSHVEGEQKLVGRSSGTKWAIEAKGVAAGPREAFVIIECRRKTTSRVKQEEIGGLAYRIKDTGATGGIIVSHSDCRREPKKLHVPRTSDP